MSKKSRDILILSLIGVILYGLLYYNFVFVDAKVKVDDIQAKIDVAQSEKRALDNDLANLATFQRNLEIKTIQNERLEEYLMSSANLADNIEYIDKLAKLFKEKITSLSVGAPQKNSLGEGAYYKFDITVVAKMDYEAAVEFINYIEGGTRKVKITNFSLVPKSEFSVADAQGVQNRLYDVNATVSVYALDLAHIDKVYEYSCDRFNRFGDMDVLDGVMFLPPEASVSQELQEVMRTVGRTNQDTISSDRDIYVSLESFLAGGQNFWVYGSGVKNPIKYKTKEKSHIKITFEGNDFDVNVTDGPYSHSMSGDIASDPIRMVVKADFPVDVIENERIAADIQIINNSTKKVNISLDDKVRRTKFFDRNGNVITKSSELEKVYIV